MEIARHSRVLLLFLFWLSTVSAVVVNHAYQAHNGVWNPYISFDKTASLYRSLQQVLPETSPANAFFVILPDDQPSEFGWGYSLFHAGNSLFGMPGYQGRLTEKGVLEQRGTTGYPGLYGPAPACAYVILKTNRDQTAVDLVSIPTSGPGKEAPCPATYAARLPLVDGKLPYFDKAFLPTQLPVLHAIFFSLDRAFAAQP
jgi:hypothetical protein